MDKDNCGYDEEEYGRMYNAAQMEAYTNDHKKRQDEYRLRQHFAWVMGEMFKEGISGKYEIRQPFVKVTDGPDEEMVRLLVIKLRDEGYMVNVVEGGGKTQIEYISWKGIIQ